MFTPGVCRMAPLCTIQVPPVSVPPDRFVKAPVKLTVPVCTSTEPVLLNGMPMVVVPDPADLWNRPALLNAGDPPPLAPIDWSVCTSNVPLLLNVPPPLKMKVLPPVHVAVPLLSSRRPWRLGKKVALKATPPLANVVPAPDMAPLFHVSRPLTVRSPLPPR